MFYELICGDGKEYHFEEYTVVRAKEHAKGYLRRHYTETMAPYVLREKKYNGEIIKEWHLSAKKISFDIKRIK